MAQDFKDVIASHRAAIRQERTQMWEAIRTGLRRIKVRKLLIKQTKGQQELMRLSEAAAPQVSHIPIEFTSSITEQVPIRYERI